MEQALESNKRALDLYTSAVRDSMQTDDYSRPIDYSDTTVKFENDASESVVDPVTPALRTAVQTRSATRRKSVSENTAK